MVNVRFSQIGLDDEYEEETKKLLKKRKQNHKKFVDNFRKNY